MPCSGWELLGSRTIPCGWIKATLLTAAAAKLLQSCPTLCDPTDGSPPGSAIPGILQARTLEWVAISFSNAWKWKVKGKSLSRVRLLATPWTVAHQAPLSMGFFQARVLEWGAIAFSETLGIKNSISDYKRKELAWALSAGVSTARELLRPLSSPLLSPERSLSLSIQAGNCRTGASEAASLGFGWLGAGHAPILM